MGKPVETLRHRWLPVSYLRAWAATDGSAPACVWRIHRDSLHGTLQPAASVSADIEQNPAPQPMFTRLEALFAPTLREVIAPMKPLGLQDRAFLGFFAAAMLARTTSERDHWQGEWQQILEQMQRRDRIVSTLYSPALVQGWATTMSGDSNRPPTLRGVGRLLSQMSICVFTTASQPFITADVPCVMYDAASDEQAIKVHAVKAQAVAAQAVALGSASTAVLLPLAPDRMLNFSWRKEFDGRYIALAESDVDSINRITRQNAEQWLIASQLQVCDRLR
jgi:Protein of unknown function (DUF4238)